MVGVKNDFASLTQKNDQGQPHICELDSHNINGAPTKKLEDEKSWWKPTRQAKSAEF